jgi:pimeloyl-ACP methyl ester carboxylesterase
MPNAQLLVPGTGGITLMDNAGKDLGSKLAKLPSPDLLELLSMEHRPGQIAPAKTSLKPGVSIRPGHALVTAYNQLPATFNHFLYDWRADMRYSAAQLLDFLQQRRPSNGRWNIVAHSQGALLTIIASKMLTKPTDFADLVATLTLVGSPLAGTVNSARALIDGDQMGASEAEEFKVIMRSWPSLYQMLPAWPALVDGNGAPLPAATQINRLAGWGTTPHIPADMMDRCATAQALIKDPLANMNGDIQLTILLGVNRATGVAIERTNGRPGDTVRTENGDSLVPYQTTMAYVGASVQPFVEGFESPCREHAFLVCDPAVATRVKQLLIA